jgi:hypothetical protein
LTIVHGLGDRGFRSWGYKNQIKSELLRSTDGLLGGEHFDVAIGKNGPDFAGANGFVDIFTNTRAAWREVSWWVHSLS